LYIIKEGEVNCSHKGEVVRTLAKGDIFGEKSILTESIRTMDVIAKTVCMCFSISVETLKAIIGKDFRDVLYLNMIKSTMKASNLLNNFDSTLIEKTYPSFCIKNYQKNEVVLSKGTFMNEMIYIIIEGNLDKVLLDLNRIMLLLLKEGQYYLKVIL
jgi:CRP-like cAMP-binding protein